MCVDSIYAGPPEPPSLTLPEQLIDMDSRLLSAFWNAPYTHANHLISHYNVIVTNIRTAEINAHSLASESGGMNIMLPFTPQTNSCDILTVTVTAVNDVGASEPATANVSIPKGISSLIIHNNHI